MDAVARGVETSVVVDDLVRHTPRPATVDALALVHDRSYLDALERFCSRGGGNLDPDTVALRGPWDVAQLAAGAGRRTTESRDGQEGDRTCRIWGSPENEKKK